MDVERNSSIGGEGEDIDIDYLSMFSSVPESHDTFIQRMKSKSIHTKSKLSPGLIKIQTLAGLSWIVNVVIHGRDYFLTNGWKKLADQLFLSIGSNLLFEYEGSNTFRLTVHNKPRDDQIGDSFVHVVINRSADEIMRGFNKICDEIPLHFMAYVIFFFESSKSLRINVYKPNGIEAILPLNENEICGVLEEEDDGDGDDDDEEEEVDDEEEEEAVIVGNLKLLQPGTSRSVPISRPYNVCEEAVEDRVVTFERKVEGRLQLPKHIVRSVKSISETTLKMRYFKAKVRSYRIRKTKAVDDRFVLDGWREFMDEYVIVKGEKYSFSYCTKSRLLVCAEKDDTEVILRSKSKGKSLKLSSSSSESSDESVEDNTESIESKLADILYNSESSERFNSEKHPLRVKYFKALAD
ncbi:hypothetical protein E3N88_15698 [Mikania micrantha]|uniref:TF-B3 domain-containing protein n=1 Tax=Mikania micrantha TaxID=192012 RepID=A0A5N6NXJ6_9ASTR|nr:hypothetical protein E3N88_15698 [Mikania micrantha]